MFLLHGLQAKIGDEGENAANYSTQNTTNYSIK